MSDDEEGGHNHVAAFETELREVLELSDMMDRFDLVSADRASCMQFRRLRSLYVFRAISLILTIEENGADIRGQLLSLIRDS